MVSYHSNWKITKTILEDWKLLGWIPQLLLKNRNWNCRTAYWWRKWDLSLVFGPGWRQAILNYPEICGITAPVNINYQVEFRIIFETNFRACLWGSFHRTLNEKGRFTLIVSTIPWSGVSVWIKGNNVVGHQCLSLPASLTMGMVWPSVPYFCCHAISITMDFSFRLQTKINSPFFGCFGKVFCQKEKL